MSASAQKQTLAERLKIASSKTLILTYKKPKNLILTNLDALMVINVETRDMRPVIG